MLKLMNSVLTVLCKFLNTELNQLNWVFGSIQKADRFCVEAVLTELCTP